MDWDEEFALQDFLKRELVERNCKEQAGNQDASPKEAADKLTDRAEDGEEKWMVVERAGEEEVRGTSTPLSAHPEEAQAGLAEGLGECGKELCPLNTADKCTCTPQKQVFNRLGLLRFLSA